MESRTGLQIWFWEFGLRAIKVLDKKCFIRPLLLIDIEKEIIVLLV
jgi:hypothetical protein